MLDLLLGTDGDLTLNGLGDISLTHSVTQAIHIRLRWFLGEWKFNPDFGVPYYEEILVKNGSKLRAKQLIHEQIMSVAGVNDVSALDVTADLQTRVMQVRFVAITDIGQIKEEISFAI